MKSHITKHWMNSHPSLPSPPKMEFTISSMFRDCLSRQIGEALKINFSKDILLNSKAEYLSNSVSRLTIKEDAWEMRERTRLEEEQDELNKKRVEEFKKLKTANIVPANHETVTTLVTEPCKMEENTAKQDQSAQEHSNYETDEEEFGSSDQEYETDEEEFSPEEATTSRGNSTRQPVGLGQSNGSSVDILVISPEYPQRQDEHPCVKTVWEMDAGGGGGVGGYETDEEEFLDSSECREHQHQLISVTTPIQARGAVENENTAKRKTETVTRSGPRNKNKIKGYQLTYLNLWWNRMDREARKDKMERERKGEESRLKECLRRGARRGRMEKGQMLLDSVEGGDISAVNQEGPKQHSGEGVPNNNFDNLKFMIKERSQIIETAVPEARQGLRRKGK